MERERTCLASSEHRGVVCAGPHGREGSLGPRNWLHGSKEEAGHQCVCDVRRGPQRVCYLHDPWYLSSPTSQCLSPAQQLGETAQPASQPASRGTRFSQREKSQSYSAARGGRQRPVFLLLRSISGSEPGGLRFPGHTWNSHREKGFILLRQWRTGRYHS